MHIDEALTQLRDCATELGYDFSEQNISENRIDVIWEYKGVDLKVWYADKTENFGFDMLQGGQKSYSDIGEFKKMITLYMHINAIVVPAAKSVADVFEQEIGVKSVYNNFKGNQEIGFMCNFSVLNDSSHIICVREKGNSTYLAQYASVTEKKVEQEKSYTVDDVGNVGTPLTIQDYVSNLYERYETSETISIRRYAESSFEFDINDEVHINADIEVDGKRFIYVIHSAIGKDNKDFINEEDERVRLKDDFSLEELGDYFIKSNEESEFEYDEEDNFDDFESESEEKEEPIDEPMTGISDILKEEQKANKPKLSGLDEELSSDEFAEESAESDDFEDFEEESEEQVEEVEEQDEAPVEEEFESEPIEEEPESKDIDKLDDELFMPQEIEETEVEEEPVEASEETQEVEEKEEISTSVENDVQVNQPNESSTEFPYEVTKIMYGTNTVGVRFSNDMEILDINIDVVQKIGFPIDSITGRVERKTRKGVLITDEEIQKRVFAKNISEDIELCKKIIFEFFL